MDKLYNVHHHRVQRKKRCQGRVRGKAGFVENFGNLFRHLL